jgi:hypothetical protein
LINHAIKYNIPNKATNRILLLVVCVALHLSAGLAEVRAGGNFETIWSEPVPLNALNTGADEFAPVWNSYENVLYFNSNVSKKSRFFTARRIDSSLFSAPAAITGELGQCESNCSYISFLSRDVAFLSTFCRYPSQSRINIFSTEKKKNVWGKPAIVKSLAGDYFTAHPAVSPDGSFMIVSSNRNSESSDLDLLISYRTADGDWAQPIPIQELNTSGNEISPCLASSDTLYFASDGLGGLGGYDLFMSVRSDGKWQSPLPLVGINSANDDSDPALLPDGSIVFASNRPGGKGGTDLWYSSPILREISSPKLLTDLELSIISPTKSVKTELDFKYSTISICPYIFPDDEVGTVRKFYSSQTVFTDSKSSVLASSLFVIASRLSERPNSGIELLVEPSTDNETDFLREKADSIRQLLTKKYGISYARISIRDGKPSASSATGRITLSSSDSSLFEPLCAGTARLDVTPANIKLLVEARPREIVEKWDCLLFLDNQKERLLATKSQLPDTLSVDLSALGAKLFSAETVDFYFNVIDKAGQLSTARYSMLNSTNVSRAPAIIASDNLSWESFLVYAPVADDIDKNPAYSRIFAGISESVKASEATSLKIIVFSKDERAAQLAKSVEKCIRKLVPPSVEFRIETGITPLTDGHFAPESTIEVRVMRKS